MSILFLIGAQLGILQSTFSDLSKAINTYTPEFIFSSFILILGYVIGKSIEKIMYIALERFLGLNTWLRKKKLDRALYNMNVSKFYSALIKWYIYFVFIAQAVTPYNVEILNKLIYSLIVLYPKIAVFGFTATVALMIAEVVKNFILSMDFPNKEKAASLAKAVTLYVLIVSVLDSLGVDVEILVDLFRLVMITIGIAIGIALGIGLGFAFRKDIEKALKSFRIKRRRKR
ncbi:MAG: hypothetical protein J7K83_03240 [Candidatus Aenigmarchaeota archaeon]|nr:hypothetical protein [Candidatus Aenigmarchaeota archaeon]